MTVAMLIAAAGLTAAQPNQLGAEQCDPAAVMNQRLDKLGRSGYVWTIEPLPAGRGVTLIDEHKVKISATVTCALMRDVVAHEWMHTLQGHKYGTNDRVYAAYTAFEVEMVADCGSMLLGSAWTPYIDQHAHETGAGCSEYELDAGRELIDKASGKPVP